MPNNVTNDVKPANYSIVKVLIGSIRINVLLVLSVFRRQLVPYSILLLMR